jgi:hypothetical protein
MMCWRVAESGECSIIDVLELWFATTWGQKINGSFTAVENMRAGFVLHWLNQDSVAVEVVQD